jgi:alkanesulfonate monooxygenase SsuD/methylene tetrahydromethanopterin reductase-like flavin-dependent oxidoreductase (luciferase family)
MVGTMGHKMLRLTARFADEWNAYYDDTGNSVEAVPALRERVDEACRDVGRDPATLARSVTVLVADAAADPWWERLPTDREEVAIKPLTGGPEETAAALSAYEPEGVSHIQICLEPTTLDTIEGFGRVLEHLGSSET